MKNKTIRINMDLTTEKGIEKAERKKEKMINKGYSLKETIRIGMDKYISVYN